ncbi:hypothetical protein SAMN05660841_04300 [Sphingobacterium nematocida]|uniref:Uncharacterized protein n=1 Tax=Sphingobacterium nematocida TaxID=1513896 RepID=A0A1T5GRG6_9SPHI|nr:hypothetical protein SAMN05660841_04300 [Sphingobacterium nematocida]
MLEAGSFKRFLLTTNDFKYYLFIYGRKAHLIVTYLIFDLCFNAECLSNHGLFFMATNR